MSPLPGSPTWPLWREVPVSRAFFYITFRVSSKIAPPGFPQRNRDPPLPDHHFIRLPKSLVNKPNPDFPTEPTYREMPVSRSFLYINVRVPSKGAPTPGFPKRAPIKREVPFPVPSNNLSNFPVDGHFVFPNVAPMERNIHLQGLLMHVSPR